MGCSGGSWGVLIEKLDERMRERSRSGGDCNIKFAFPVKLDRGSPIQGFGLLKFLLCRVWTTVWWQNHP